MHVDVNEIFNIISLLFERFGYPIIFAGSLIEITPLGWAVPGGAILAIAGYLANGNADMPVVPIIICGTLGAWAAFILAYFLGRKTGMWLVNKLHQEKNAAFAKTLLRNNGGIILTTSMMANLTRFWVSYIAGVEKYDFIKFNLYAFVSSLTWVSLMTILGYLAGYEKQNLKALTGSIGILAWILLIIAAAVLYRSIKKEHYHFKKDIPHEQYKDH
jgi:membrane protein DedA with SNARE-associated domain